MSVESDIKAMVRFSKTITTREKALEVLRKSGIVNKNGVMKKKYRRAFYGS